MEKKWLAFIVAALLATSYVFADNYKVLYVNSSGIKINNNSITVGKVFSDKDKIIWSGDQQAIKVVNLKTNRIVVLAAKAMKKKKTSSLYEYLTGTKHLSTRNLKERIILEEWQIDSILYLLDTLYIRRPYMEEKSTVAQIVNDKGNLIDIPISKDGKSYMITREVYGRITPVFAKFTIKEYDKAKEWEYIVYRNLIIEPIQIKP